jgi:hypothetical protein
MTPPPSSITGSTARQAPERREERAADLCLDLRFLILRERLGPNRAADVINQDVDAAEARSCPLHRCGRAAKTFQVCDGGERLGSRLLPHLLDEVGPIHEGDASPFPCQPQRDITADALCRASHHGSLASEAVRIGRHRGLTPLAGGSLKKDSVPAIVASSRASLLGGATDAAAYPDHDGLRSGCSVKPALRGSRNFLSAHHLVIGSNSFVRHALSGAASYANCRFDRLDETYRNSPLALAWDQIAPTHPSILL